MLFYQDSKRYILLYVIYHLKLSHNIQIYKLFIFKVHEKVHLGGKPYHCDMCDAKFSNKFDLYAHEKEHSDQRPHKCNMCQVHILFAFLILMISRYQCHFPSLKRSTGFYLGCLNINLKSSIV